eukprot:1158978-Pelagomonas_calceolata.AAC.4
MLLLSMVILPSEKPPVQVSTCPSRAAVAPYYWHGADAVCGFMVRDSFPENLALLRLIFMRILAQLRCSVEGRKSAAVRCLLRCSIDGSIFHANPPINGFAANAECEQTAVSSLHHPLCVRVCPSLFPYRVAPFALGLTIYKLPLKLLGHRTCLAGLLIQTSPYGHRSYYSSPSLKTSPSELRPPSLKV